MSRTYISSVSKDETHTVGYSFVCEHCGANSGPLTTVITGRGYRESGYIKFTPNGEVSQETHNEVIAEALAALAKKMQQTYDFAQKGQYGHFESKCPHCKQPQSWSLKGSIADSFIGALVVGVVAALVLMALRFFFRLPVSNMLHAAISIVAFVVALAIFFIKYAITKAKVKNVVQKQRPVIEWNWNFGTQPDA